MSENQASFSGWARVEINGHNTHIGHVTTEVFGQAVLFRVDQPHIPGTEETLTRAEWIGEVYAQPGSVVKREDIQAASVLVGPGSIYRITPLSEEAAMLAIRSSQRRPLIPVRLVEGKQIAPAMDEDEEEDDEDNSHQHSGGAF